MESYPSDGIFLILKLEEEIFFKIVKSTYIKT